MRKRACLARMLLYGAETALLDEPFAALDAQLKLAMHDLVLRLAAENKQTVILVTHDLMEAVTLADRVLVCTRRPATVAHEQRIDLARPRDVLNVRFSNEFKEHYDALWERLRVEYEEDQLPPRRRRSPAARGDRARYRRTAGATAARRRPRNGVLALLLGVALLLAWQGASGRLVDNFFISNPIDVAVRLWGWISDGSILAHLGDRLCDDARLFHWGGRRSDPGHLARTLAVRQPAA